MTLIAFGIATMLYTFFISQPHNDLYNFFIGVGYTMSIAGLLLHLHKKGTP
jgi:hypothetical protein